MAGMSSETRRLPATVRHFTQLLSSTRRGARLARLLATGALQTWDVPPAVAERAEHIVAELAANAVFHGRVRGRDFRLGLTLDPAAGTLRAEVTDELARELLVHDTAFLREVRGGAEAAAYLLGLRGAEGLPEPDLVRNLLSFVLLGEPGPYVGQGEQRAVGPAARR